MFPKFLVCILEDMILRYDMLYVQGKNIYSVYNEST